MGRRKKRDNSKKRSLVFEESPAEKGHHPYSPVLCVDHPITAASVTVDDDCNVSWISPQFNGITASHGKRRQARRPPSHRKAAAGNRPGESLARGNLSTRTRHHDNARSCRFPALDFVGDHSRKGARKSRRSSPCQEVNVSAEDGLETSELRSKDRTQIQQSNRRPETNTHSSDGEIKTKRRRSHRSSVKIDGVNHDCNENSDETSGEKNNDEDKRRKLGKDRRGRRDVLGVENLNWSENNDNNTRDGRESFVRDTELGVDCEYGQVEKQRRQTVFGKSAERIPRPSLAPLTSFCENEAGLRTTKQPHTLSAAPKTTKTNAHLHEGRRRSLDRMCRSQNNSSSEIMQGTERDVQQRITEHNSSRLSHLSFAAERNSSQKQKKGQRRKSYHSDILVSPAEMEAWPASPHSLLQVRQDSLLGPLRVNLFAGSPSDVSIPGSSQNHNVSVASSAKNDDCGVRGVGTTNSKANVSDSSCNYEGLHRASEQEEPSQSSFTKLNDPRNQKLKRQKLTVKRQNFGNNKYQLSPRSSEGDLRRSLSEGHLRRSMSEGHLRRSKRLQDKRVEALRCLFPYTPPGASQKARPNVLVSDTPENAYHLSYRQKQQLGIY